VSDTEATQTGWRKRIQEIGKAAFTREEMKRLGFWPPDEETAAKAAEAEAQLERLYAELAAGRVELREVEKQIAEAESVEDMIAEIRKRRIERVRAAREVRKAEKAQALEVKRAEEKAWRETTLPYLGRGVSGGLQYAGGDAAKVEASGLPALATASDVAASIGIPEKELGWLTYHRGASAVDHYARFTIPKKRGGERVISSPKRKLRVAQSWLLRSILTPLEVHPAAMAFRPGRCITDNAKPHVGKAIVVKMDLKDFFPSITFRRVKGFFVKLGYNEGVATLLALIATEAPRVAATLDGVKQFVSIGERQLPQGACTSPALTNLLCRRMDARLTGAAQEYGFTYTRYADDLVFSHAEANGDLGGLLGLVRSVIAKEGFVINEEKTAVMRPQHRQAVTGIVVNETPRVSRRDARRFRAFLHQLEKHGAKTMSEKIGKNALYYASGYLAFLHMVNPEQEAKIRNGEG
jgi:RNA-directed DNA polymerase